MTNRIVEAKIILLIWLFSASIVTCSAVSFAVAISADVAEFINIAQEQNGDVVGLDYASNSSHPSDVEGSG